MAAKYTMNIDAGATFTHQFDYLDNAGEPIDLTGYTALMQIRLKPSSLLVVESVPTINTTTSTVSVTLTAAQTATLIAPQYVYAIELTAAGGEPVIRLIEGNVLVSPEVVRPEGD